jgi:hypothetical protein
LEGHKLVLKSRRSQGSFLLIFFRNTAGLQQSLRQSIRLADHRSGRLVLLRHLRRSGGVATNK